jgi:TrpR-related protein YerC/YecD
MEYNSRIKSKEVDAFFEAVLTLDNMEECYRFFEDICTVRELQSISQRLEVAKLLKMGKTYNYIEESTGASTATISRVNRCLHYGADGYKIILERLEISDEESDKEDK